MTTVHNFCSRAFWFDKHAGKTQCQRNYNYIQYHILVGGDYVACLVQDCSNSSAIAMELLKSCSKPAHYLYKWWCLTYMGLEHYVVNLMSAKDLGCVLRPLSISPRVDLPWYHIYFITGDKNISYPTIYIALEIRRRVSIGNAETSYNFWHKVHSRSVTTGTSSTN